MRPQNEAELAQILVEAQSPVEIIGGGTRAIGDVVAGLHHFTQMGLQASSFMNRER